MDSSQALLLVSAATLSPPPMLNLRSTSRFPEPHQAMHEAKKEKVADNCTQYWIIRGKFPASRGSIFLITAVTVALIITSLVVVVTVDPSAFEKRR